MKKSIFLFVLLMLGSYLFAEEFGTITGDRVRIRTKPTVLKSDTITYLNKGYEVTIIKKTKTKEKVGGAENYWYRVGLADGKEGWVFGSFIRINPKIIPVTKKGQSPEEPVQMTPAVSDLSSIAILEDERGDHSLALLLVDKEGRRTGFDKESNKILLEIPGSEYTRDKASGRVKIFIHKPSRGLYKLTMYSLRGFKSGFSFVYIHAIKSSGKLAGGANLMPEIERNIGFDRAEIFYSPLEEEKTIIKHTVNLLNIETDTDLHLTLQDSSGFKLGWDKNSDKSIAEIHGMYEENWCEREMDDIPVTPLMTKLGVWHVSDRDTFTVDIVGKTAIIYKLRIQIANHYSKKNIICSKDILGITGLDGVQRVKIDFSPFESEVSTITKIVDLATLKEELATAHKYNFIADKASVDSLTEKLDIIDEAQSKEDRINEVNNLIRLLHQIKDKLDNDPNLKPEYEVPGPVIHPDTPEDTKKWILENYNNNWYNTTINPIDILIADARTYLNSLK